METVVILLALFGIKHFLADFLWQFPYMTRDKGTYLADGGLHHSAIHGLGTWTVLMFFVHPGLAISLAVLDAVIHYHIDWAKTNLSHGLNANDHRFWVWFGLDQALHYLTYIAIIGIIVL